MRSLLAALFLCLLIFPAQARHHHPAGQFRSGNIGPSGQDGRWGDAIDRPSQDSRRAQRQNRMASPGDSGGGQMVSHPAGCPSRAFCGCGAAVYLFRSPIRSLWLARNWLRFPPASPGPGMAAVRSHHVMVILAYHGNGMATVYDANSGGHGTRIHERSIAGYRVVNPRLT